MKRIYLYFTFILFLLSIPLEAQVRKALNQPFADQKMYHLGFMVGFQAQDMILSHTGFKQENGDVWFAEIPSYSPGFSVGIIGDRYLNEHFNLRLCPSLHFGERKFVFKEQNSGIEYPTTIRANHMYIPLYVKYSAARMRNVRPYILAGGYTSFDIAPKKDDALRFKKADYGLEFGIGCNIYLPLFKLCPELKFSFGLVDLVEKDRSDLPDKDLVKYTQAISSGKSRMISLIFNFE